MDMALELLARLSMDPMPVKYIVEDLKVPVRRTRLKRGERCLMDLVDELRSKHGLAIESQHCKPPDGHCLWIRRGDWGKAQVIAQLYLNTVDT